MDPLDASSPAESFPLNEGIEENVAWAPTLYILIPEHIVFCLLSWCFFISNPPSSLHGLILWSVLCFPILGALRIYMCWELDHLLI